PRAGRERRRITTLAVALVLVVGVAWGWWAAHGEAPSDPVASVALLALNDHLDTHDQKVYASDPEALRAALQPHIGFPVRVPELGAALRPVGGRPCTLGSHPVAFSAWRAPAGRVTLIQMRRADFGLPADMAPQVVTPSGAAARGRPLDVLFFGQGDTVWVVVADDADDLRRIRQAVSNS
ncbi:MAG: hypothetical protein O2894_08945, partial [Planctomycetota bacterium]|nr:hypothetical protein [Planctomycetota bacterium]